MNPFATVLSESSTGATPAPSKAVPRLLVAGIGNIFLGDDAFGVEVAQRLAQRGLPAEARLVDFGIRGLDLTYALLDGYETVILIDACPRGGAPGTLYVLETEPAAAGANAADPATASPAMIDTHAMDPVKVLRLAAAMGSPVKRVLLVGCEPSPRVEDANLDMNMEMSAAVRAAVDPAVEMVETLVTRILSGASATATAGK